MEFQDFPSCQALTKASLQRFSRGPEVMKTLSKFLQERVELENKMKKYRNDFLFKWNKTLTNEIGCNMPKDDVKEVMKLILACEGRKSNFHCQTTFNLQNVHGPIPVLDNYTHNSSCMVDIMNMKSLYNDTMDVQKKLENNIETGEKAYFRALKKEEKMIKDIDELEKAGENSRVVGLANQMIQLTYNSSKMLDNYTNTIQAERKNRTTFQNEMSEFHTQSTRYETIRLETVKRTLQKYLSLEKEHEEERVSLKEMLDQALLTLRNYDIQAEIDELDQICRYQHNFPQHTWHEDASKTAKHQKDGENSASKTEKNEDEVQVLMVPKEDDVLFTKSTKHPDLGNETENQSVHKVAAQKCDVPSNFDLPNIVTDKTHQKAPRVKTTTIMDSDSDSSSEGELSPRAHPEGTTGQMKVKVYGIKTFSARTEEEISFKRGHKVYMTVAGNAEGLAYGYVKKGKLLKKKKVYGYFPAKLVSSDAKKRSPFKPRNPFKKPTKVESNVHA